MDANVYGMLSKVLRGGNCSLSTKSLIECIKSIMLNFDDIFLVESNTGGLGTTISIKFRDTEEYPSLRFSQCSKEIKISMPENKDKDPLINTILSDFDFNTSLIHDTLLMMFAIKAYQICPQKVSMGVFPGSINNSDLRITNRPSDLKKSFFYSFDSSNTLCKSPLFSVPNQEGVYAYGDIDMVNTHEFFSGPITLQIRHFFVKTNGHLSFKRHILVIHAKPRSLIPDKKELQEASFM